MIKKIIKFILIVLWMGVIFMFSNDSGEASSKKSDYVIVNIYNVISKTDLTKQQEQHLVEKVVYPVRKLAHFTEYFILGLLIISFLSEFYYVSIKSIIIAIILSLLYAVGDEIHQMFSDDRTPKILDVIIDTLGSTTSILIYFFITKRYLGEKKYE